MHSFKVLILEAITVFTQFSRRFTSKAVVWAILNEFDFAVDCSL